MNIFLSLIIDILQQGLIYGLMVLGLYISYKILNFPDLSVDGSFPLGAAVGTICILAGFNPWLALILAFLAGAVAGIVTGILHVYMKITPLFSGILVMTVLFSVNLTIVGKSNVPLFDQASIFNTFPATILPEENGIRTVVVALIILLFCKLALDLFLKTKIGVLLRAVGDNEQVVIAVGVNPGYIKIMGLSMANALVALSGAVLSQQLRFFEISMGTGVLIIGLASVIMGTVLFEKASRFMHASTMAVAGSIIYKALVSLAIYMGAPPNYLNLIRGILFMLVLLLYQLRQKKQGGLGRA